MSTHPAVAAFAGTALSCPPAAWSASPYRLNAEENAKLDALLSAAGLAQSGQHRAIRALWERGRGNARIETTNKQIAEQAGRCERWVEKNLPPALQRLAELGVELVSLVAPGHKGRPSVYSTQVLRECLDELNDAAPVSVEAYPVTAQEIIRRRQPATPPGPQGKASRKRPKALPVPVHVAEQAAIRLVTRVSEATTDPEVELDALVHGAHPIISRIEELQAAIARQKAQSNELLGLNDPQPELPELCSGYDAPITPQNGGPQNEYYDPHDSGVIELTSKEGRDREGEGFLSPHGPLMQDDAEPRGFRMADTAEIKPALARLEAIGTTWLLVDTINATTGEIEEEAGETHVSILADVARNAISQGLHLIVYPLSQDEARDRGLEDGEGDPAPTQLDEARHQAPEPERRSSRSERQQFHSRQQRSGFNAEYNSENLNRRLEELVEQQASNKRGFIHCPLHADSTASCHVTKKGNAIYLYCFPCRLNGKQILSELDGGKPPVPIPEYEARPSQKGRGCGNGSTPEAEYIYRDEQGKWFYRVQRWQGKSFPTYPWRGGEWRKGKGCMKGVPRILYRLPELLAADPADLVFFVEGEKSANLLADLGLVVTSSGGSLTWNPNTMVEPLRGRHVIVLPDNDEPGRELARQVISSLCGQAASVTVLELPGLAEHEDVYDWLMTHGHSVGELRGLARSESMP